MITETFNSNTINTDTPLACILYQSKTSDLYPEEEIIVV